MGIIKFFTKGGNFGLIARNQAYLHQRITLSYRDRFVDSKSIYHAVSYINMSSYIKKNPILLGKAFLAIENLRENDDEYATQGCLIDFVFSMQEIMFSVDSPRNVYVLKESRAILQTIIQNVEETVNQVSSGVLKKKSYDRAIDLLVNTNQSDLRELIGLLD